MNSPQYFTSDPKELLPKLGKEKLVNVLKEMLLIRNFEIRAEAAYQQGKVGGFFHAYIGQEAIQASLIQALGKDHWFTTTYRCHALALLLGATPNEVMAELYGKETGNAKGRGGSMHLYTEQMLGGFGIVGGHVPIATGAGFALKYQENHEKLSFCFMGEGATVQGSIHESLNLASLWNLPVIYIVENNLWGMGTKVNRAVSFSPIAEKLASCYGLNGYTVDGMNYFHCYALFEKVAKEVKQTQKPVIIEAITERFKGHSVSDPGLYRSKEELKKAMERDPVLYLKKLMEEAKMITEEEFKQIDKEKRELVIQAMDFAEKSPYPNPITLEEDVFAP